MGDGQWQRYGAFGGIVFVVLAVVSSFIAGQPPESTDRGVEILEYLDDNDGAIRVGAYLSALAIFPLLWWAGSLWSTLRRAEGGAPRLTVVAGLGLAVAAGGAGVSFAITSMMALRQNELGPGGAKVFYSLTFTMLGVSAAGLAALVLATSVILLRSRLYPAWVGWLGAALGVLWLVAAVNVATDNSAVSTLGFVAFLLWGAWIIVISVLMLRERESVTT